MREGAQADGCICSVAFWAPPWSLGKGCCGLSGIRGGGAISDAYPFIKEIPPERWIAHPEGGYEVYCIVPTDQKLPQPSIHGDINEDNDFFSWRKRPGTLPQRLWGSVLLLGNLSDIMPSLDVEIVDSTGGSLSYQPPLWLYVGSLSGPSEIFDFTMYHDPDFIGIWSAVIPAGIRRGGIS